MSLLKHERVNVSPCHGSTSLEDIEETVPIKESRKCTVLLIVFLVGCVSVAGELIWDLYKNNLQEMKQLIKEELSVEETTFKEEIDRLKILLNHHEDQIKKISEREMNYQHTIDNEIVKMNEQLQRSSTEVHKVEVSGDVFMGKLAVMVAGLDERIKEQEKKEGVMDKFFNGLYVKVKQDEKAKSEALKVLNTVMGGMNDRIFELEMGNRMNDENVVRVDQKHEILKEVVIDIPIKTIKTTLSQTNEKPIEITPDPNIGNLQVSTSEETIVNRKHSVSSIAKLIEDPAKIEKYYYNLFSAGTFLYENPEIVAKRTSFNNHRIQLMKNYLDKYPELAIGQYSIQTTTTFSSNDQNHLDEDYLRLEHKYNLSHYTSELPLCIITPGYNNNANFRIEYALNSIFLQNYTNYHVVVIDDASIDGSQEIYKRYFEYYGLEDKAVLILNEKRINSLENVYTSAMKYCNKDEIGVIMDGDDEFLGRNVFKFFNMEYQLNNYGFFYSQTLIRYVQRETYDIVTNWITEDYSQHVKDNQLYRNDSNYFFAPRTFKIELLYEVNVKDLQDESGRFYTVTSDSAMFFPVIELACGNVGYVAEKNYIWNLETGINDGLTHREEQEKVDRIIHSAKAYPCAKMYGGYKSRAEAEIMRKKKEGGEKKENKELGNVRNQG